MESYPDPRTVVRSTACTHRRRTETWDDYDSLFYNAWLRVDIAPTRFIDEATVRQLGLWHDLRDMISQLGLGTMTSLSTWCR